MSVNAKFSPESAGNIEFKNIEGYRIAGLLHPTTGFNGNFFVYIHELISEEDDFSGITVESSSAGRLTGELSFNDHATERYYSFKNIDLVSVQTFLTHKRKDRFLTFQYRAVITDAGDYCNVDNKAASRSAALDPNRMGRDYAYRVNGSAESLLSFSSRITRGSNVMFRLGAVRNNNNSFLDMSKELDNQRVNGGIQSHSIQVKDFSIDFDKETLQGLFVDESYGSFLTFGVTSLDTIAQTDTDSYEHLMKIDFPSILPIDYLNYAQNPGTIKKMNQRSSIETATIILQKGNGMKISSSII